MNTELDTSNYDECRTKMQKLNRSHYTRSVILAILAIVNGYLHVITLPITIGSKIPETSFARNAIFTNGFGYAVLAFLCTIAVLVLGFLLRQERGKLLLIPAGIALLCTCTGLFHVFLGSAMIIVLAIGLYESRTAVWLKEQIGYPYFNERFAEQDFNAFSEYQSRYDIRSVENGGDMPDIGGETDPINIPKTYVMPDAVQQENHYE